MAKITSSSSRMPVAVEVPSTPQPVATQTTALTTPAPLNAIETFADPKQKLLSLGRTNKTPALLRGTPPAGSFQIKNGALAAGTTKAKDPAIKEMVGQTTGKIAGDYIKSFDAACIGKTPDQQLAAFKALPKDVQAAITKQVTTNASSFDGPAALAVVRSMSPKDFAAAVETMRADGGKTRTPFQLALGSELAANTAWGKSPANAKIVEQMRASIARGATGFGETTKGATAETSDSAIIIGANTAKSPEYLAATLAHESTHAENFAESKKLDKLSEENSGIDTELAVFKELKDKNPKAMSSLPEDARTRYQAYLDTGSVAGQHARTAGMYAKEARLLFQDGKKYGKQQVEEIVTQLAKEPATVAALTPTSVGQLIEAVIATGGSLKELGAALKDAPANVKKAALDYVEKQPDAATDLKRGWGER